ASVRVVCQMQPTPDSPALHGLAVELNLFRPRTGEKVRPLGEIIELTGRATHEEEMFSPTDWEFIQWLGETYPDGRDGGDTLILTGLELLQWLGRWGHTNRLELGQKSLKFYGQVADLTPHLENGQTELSLVHSLSLPQSGSQHLKDARFFSGRPALVLVKDTFYLLRNVPPPALLEYWTKTPAILVRKLSHRFRTQLRRTQAGNGVDWEQLCVTHRAVPQFIFELNEDTVRLRLQARSERDRSLWQWNGQDWQLEQAEPRSNDKPQVLEDSRLDLATQWLRRLDWFTPEPGIWVG